MILPPTYEFYYNDAYPTKSWRLCKIDPITGDIIGYVNDYPTYRKILLSKPELKRHYYPNVPADRRILLGALRSLKNHNYNREFVIKLAMKMGTLPEDLEKLIISSNPSYNSQFTTGRIPDIIEIPGPTTKLDRKDSDIIDLNKLSSKKKTDIIDIGRKKGKVGKPKPKRKIKKCKCKK